MSTSACAQPVSSAPPAVEVGRDWTVRPCTYSTTENGAPITATSSGSRQCGRPVPPIPAGRCPRGTRGPRRAPTASARCRAGGARPGRPLVVDPEGQVGAPASDQPALSGPATCSRSRQETPGACSWSGPSSAISEPGGAAGQLGPLSGDRPAVHLGGAVVDPERPDLPRRTARGAGRRRPRGRRTSARPGRRSGRSPRRRRSWRSRSTAEARAPWSSSQQARSSSARVAAMSISLSAISCWIIPRSASRDAERLALGDVAAAPPRAHGARPPASASRGSSGPARAEPARWRSPRSTSPSTPSSGTKTSLERTSQWPPSIDRSSGADVPADLEARRRPPAPGTSSLRRGRPADPLVRAITMKKPAPSAPVMNHLRPLIRQPPSTLVAAVGSARRVGAGAGRRLGHRERRADLAPHQRSEELAPAGSASRHAASRCTLPSSGAAMLSASGPNSEYPPPRTPVPAIDHAEPEAAELARGACGLSSPARGPPPAAPPAAPSPPAPFDVTGEARPRPGARAPGRMPSVRVVR